MGKAIDKIYYTNFEKKDRVAIMCPGCEEVHWMALKPHEGGIHTFVNENHSKPTFSPSLVHDWTHTQTGARNVCHCFIRDGQFQFLNDCTHHLKGKTVPVPDLPEWLR